MTRIDDDSVRLDGTPLPHAPRVIRRDLRRIKNFNSGRVSLVHPNDWCPDLSKKSETPFFNKPRVIGNMRAIVVPVWVGARANFSEEDAGTGQVSMLHQRRKSGMSKTSECCSSSKTRGTSREEGTSFDPSSSVGRAIGIWLVRVGSSGSARCAAV